MLRGLARKLRAMIQSLAHALWKLRYADKNNEVWASVYDEAKLCLSASDYRAYRIASMGGSQKEKIAVFRSICRYKPDIVLDVGANYGEFSVVAARAGLQCLSVEPNPHVSSKLIKTMSIYPEAQVFRFALSDIEGQAELYFCRTASGSGSLASGVAKSEAAFRGLSVDKTRVAVHTADNLLRPFLSSNPGGILLKIDVEGHEKEVLQGARQALESVKWWRALVEFSPEALCCARKSVSDEWEYYKEYKGLLFASGKDWSFSEELLRTLPPLTGDIPQHDVELLLGVGTITRTYTDII